MHLQNRIIAEIGSVHDGSFGNAIKLIANFELKLKMYLK